MYKLLVIDNYDSFTYNLVQMFRQYPLKVAVFRSDGIELDRVEQEQPDYLLISPGPKDPAHAGICLPLIAQWYKRVPILGVCLGMQCINETFGGQTIRSPQPLHGKTSEVYHHSCGLFAGLPSPFHAARYHSLVTALNGDSPLQIAAHTVDEIIMSLYHPHYPLWGVQFHPESFLTDYGFNIIENFLDLGPMKASHDHRHQ